MVQSAESDNVRPGTVIRSSTTMARELRRTGKYRLRQEAIVKSAVDVLNRKGVRGMTLAEVAAKLELVPTGIIYYFATKEDLAAACLLKAIEAYNRLIDEAAQAPTREARLAVLVRGYFALRRDVASGRADPIAFFNDVRALGDAAVNEAYVGMFRRARGLLQPVPPPAGFDRSVLNAHTHHVLSQLFWAVAWLPQYDPDDFERAGERVLDILLTGIGAEGQIWAPAPLQLPAPDTTANAAWEAFLRAATELINQQGYRGASVKKISARANVTKGSFYHHNEGKDDLVVACFERTLDVMRAAQRAANLLPSSGWVRLGSASATLVDLQTAGGAPLLRTSALTSTPEAMQAQLIRKFDRVSGHFAAMISDGIADGSIRPIDANICAQMITGTLNASAELNFWARGLSPDQASRVFLQPLFEGVLASTTT